MCWTPRILEDEAEGGISPINAQALGLDFADTKLTKDRSPKGRPRSRVRGRPAKRALRPTHHHLNITEDINE